MNRIDKTFASLRADNRRALITYFSAGDPGLNFTRVLLQELPERGVDLVELGIPFSDPLADGPVIQRASARALAGGVKMDSILELVSDFREDSELPLLLMGYYNSLYAYGQDRFIQRCAEAGVDGLIIPDLPPEEAAGLMEVAGAVDLSLIFLLAPTSTEGRIKRVVEVQRSGFIYCVSVTGVTGAREGSYHRLDALCDRLRQLTDLPLAAGFGISTPEQASDLADITDGIIVGSALVRIVEKHLAEIEEGNYNPALEEIASLTESLKTGLNAKLND